MKEVEKEVKYEDFPINVTNAVRAAFEVNMVTQRSAEVLVRAILSELRISLSRIKPWEILSKEMPAVERFRKKNPSIILTFDHTDNKVDIKHKDIYP